MNPEEIRMLIKVLEEELRQKEQEAPQKPGEWKITVTPHTGMALWPATRCISYHEGDPFSKALAEFVARKLNELQGTEVACDASSTEECLCYALRKLNRGEAPDA